MKGLFVRYGVDALFTKEKKLLSNALYYQHKGDWVLLPTWAQFFLELGFALATRGNSEDRIVTGLALPIRSYAAPFIAAGIIIGRLALPVKNHDALERFEQIRALPIGTSLSYRNIGSRVRGPFGGIKESKDGNSMILLQAGNDVYSIPSTLALQVDLPLEIHEPLSKLSIRRKKTSIHPFLSFFLDQERVTAAALQSHLDCAIIGPIGRLTAEISETKFAVKTTNRGFVPGTLQDIIRTRRLSKETEAYRSELYYTHTREFERKWQDIPAFILFDGAVSFLKWRDFWRCSNWIVLLDQTETDFDAAIHTFNEECMKNEVKKASLKVPFSPPSRLPIAIYQENRI